MLITNKSQYTYHKTFTWLRVSLTCYTYVLGGGGGGVELDSYWYFPLINQHLLRGVRKKPWDDQGRLPKNERQK